jgi:hypothetical protein
LVSVSRVARSRAMRVEPREKMNENAPGRIRFCNEYEELLKEFLRAWMRWKHGHQPGSAETRGKMELLLAERGYIEALAALQVHSRECVLCEEKLRVYVNDSSSSAATSSMS